MDPREVAPSMILKPEELVRIGVSSRESRGWGLRQENYM